MSAAAVTRLTRRHSGAVVAGLATVSALAALARRQPLSWDEAVTVAVSTRPVSAIAVTLHHTDAVLGSYYLLVHGWSSLLVSAGVRPTESWWRLPSAAAAVATCVLVERLARRHAGPVAGLVAGSSLAVMPLFAFYAVDARPYTLAAAVIVLAWSVWTRTTPNRRTLLSTTIVIGLMVAAAWLQLFTVLVWPAFVLVDTRRSFARALSVPVVAAGAVVPLIAVALRQQSEIGWIPAASPATTVSVALHVGGGVVVAVLLTVLAGLAVRTRPVRASRTRTATAWWCCAPLAGLAVLDLVRPVLVARYALVSLPMIAVVVGVAVARAAPGPRCRWVRAVAAATGVAAVATSAVQGAHDWKYEDYRGAADFAVHDVPTGTPVVFAPASARLGFDVYAQRGRLADLALAGGVVADPLAIGEEAPPLLREQLAASCRVVVVGDPVGGVRSGLPVPDRVKLSDVDGWRIDATRGFGAVTVTVLTGPSCGRQPPAAG